MSESGTREGGSCAAQKISLLTTTTGKMRARQKAPSARLPRGEIKRANRSTLEILESRVFLSAGIPRYDHVVIVMEENHGYTSVIGNSQASYINSLATAGVNFTNMHALTHPS